MSNDRDGWEVYASAPAARREAAAAASAVLAEEPAEKDAFSDIVSLINGLVCCRNRGAVRLISSRMLMSNHSLQYLCIG